MGGGTAVAATRRQLAERCEKSPLPELVWTPESDALVEPWEVPWLFAAFVRQRLDAVREQMKVYGFMFGAWIVITLIVLASGEGVPAFNAIFLVLSASTLAQHVMTYRQLKRLTPASFATQVAEMRALPAARAGRPVFTWALAAIIALVAVAQSLSPGSSPEAAGLVKDAVRAGEWWRLFTTPLLHGNILHLLMNGGALLALGTLVERYAHRAFVPLVFLLAALAGDAGSFLVFPHTTSVGASGGIMGMVGFALALSLRRRALLPKSLASAILRDIGWIAVMGLAGYRFIDNGAHAGGLLAGIAVGALLVPRGGATPHWEPAPAVRAAGWAALAVIAASAIAAAVVMFGVPVM